LAVGDHRPDLSKTLVVKIGGSLAETGRLKDMLALIAAAQRPVVVVPGGGAFAQKVRDLQNAIRFDDASAHRLAMLGMHQMAEIYFTMDPRYAAADSLDGIARQLAVGLIPVWMPLQMCQSDPEIPANWTITSDGLAARLAEHLGGAALILLKSADVQRGETAEQLAAEGIVDATFPVIVARSRLAWGIMGPSDDARLASLLADHSMAISNS
jgi:5-(aminomethyl)-3-furanmethanol phosphate kinase